MTLYSLTLPSQLIQLALSGFVFAVFLLIFNFVLLPLSQLQYYKKQGILTRFIPLLGFFALLQKGEKEHDDNLYHVKKNAQKNPNLEIEAYNVGNRAFVMLYSPRLLKSFLTNGDDQNYQKYKRLQPITLFSRLGFASLNGRIFKEHRKIVAKLFSYDNLSRGLPAMHVNALKVIDAILKTQNLNNVALQKYTLAFAADNFSDVFFGGHTKYYFVDGKPVLNFTNDLQSESGILTRTLPLLLFGPGIVKFGLWKSHREFNGKVKRLKAEVNRLIQDRKAKTEQREVDLLDILLETQKSNDPDIAYTDDMIVGEYISLFVSSAENPSHLMVFCLYLLDNHPEFKKKIMEEIHEVYEKEPLSSHSLHKMNHLHALIQETLRLQSPSFASQPRVALKDFNVENYKIKEGTVIMPLFFHQHYSENVFEDAFKFKPERWLDQNLRLDPYAFIPFSAGPRNCIRQHLSGLEMKLLLCEFLKKFDFKVSPDFKLIKTQRFLNVPRDPILFNLTLRENI